MMGLLANEKWFRLVEELVNNPRTEYSLSELSRKTRVSKAFTTQVIEELEKEKFVETRRIGNMKLVKLSKNRKVKLLKSWYFAQKLLELEIEKVADGYVSLALFGSHAKGEYDNKSDIDILLVGPVSSKDISMKVVSKIEKATKKSLDIKLYSLSDWENMKNKCDKFALNILGSHILLGGEPL